MSFSNQLKKLAEKRKQTLEQVFRGTLLDIGSMIIIQSPHDTGRFRLNWNFSQGRIDPSTNDRTSPSKSSSQSEAIGKLEAALKDFQIGQVFYMSNNLPYAIPLEYGHSTQAPKGMVRLSVRQYKKFLRDRTRGAND